MHFNKLPECAWVDNFSLCRVWPHRGCCKIRVYSLSLWITGNVKSSQSRMRPEKISLVLDVVPWTITICRIDNQANFLTFKCSPCTLVCLFERLQRYALATLYSFSSSSFSLIWVIPPSPFACRCRSSRSLRCIFVKSNRICRLHKAKATSLTKRGSSNTPNAMHTTATRRRDAQIDTHGIYIRHE